MPNWWQIGALSGLILSLVYVTLIVFYTLVIDDLRGYTLYPPPTWGKAESIVYTELSRTR